MKRLFMVSSMIIDGRKDSAKCTVKTIDYVSLFDAHPRMDDTSARMVLKKLRKTSKLVKPFDSARKVQSYAHGTGSYERFEFDLQAEFERFDSINKAVEWLIGDVSLGSEWFVDSGPLALYDFACNMFSKVKRQRIASYSRTDGGDLLVIDSQDVDDCVNDMYLQLMLAYRHMLENPEPLPLGRYVEVKRLSRNSGDDVPFDAIIAKALHEEIREAVETLTPNEAMQLALLKLEKKTRPLNKDENTLFWHLVNKQRTVLKAVDRREVADFGQFLYVSNILAGMVYDVYVMRKRRAISTLSALHDTANKYGLQKSDDGMIELNTVHGIMDARKQKLDDSKAKAYDVMDMLELVSYYNDSLKDVITAKEINVLHELLARKADNNVVLTGAERTRLSRIKAKIVDYYGIVQKEV